MWTILSKLDRIAVYLYNCFQWKAKL